MKQLADYMQYMQTEDVLAATERAKVEARTLLEDQGVTMLALLMADLLTDTIQRGWPGVLETTPAKPSSLS